ncbi:MAG: uroporphyrinogen-III C-methyltransferase [bacterium]
MPENTGFVTLVGAGPGDPDLLTIGAVRALQQAEVVIHDALLSPAILAHCPPGAERIDAGKRAGAHSMSQDAITQLLVTNALAGKRIVRLKGGDPFVFGRGGEEALALRAAGVPFSVIPGVTSAVAVPAYAGIPVTHRGVARNFAVITGMDADSGESHDWQALAKMETLVVLMGAARLPDVVRKLIDAGRDPVTPAASISNGTLPSQQAVVATLGTIAEAAASLPTPLITVIGDVVSLAPNISWRESLPLAGKVVVVTRTRSQASSLRVSLEALGARVIEAPVLEIRHSALDLTTDERLSSRWDWVVFTSQNAVEAFFEALAHAGKDARALASTKVAAIGAATAGALRAAAVLPDFVPALATSQSLAAELPRVDGARILLPVGSLSDQSLADGLRARGGHIEQVKVYETNPAELSDEVAAAVLSADAITFASASAARFLRAALGERTPSSSTQLCAIGPQAAEATRLAFDRVDAVAAEPSIEGLVVAVRESLR